MASSDEVVVDLQNYKDRVGTRVVPGRYRVRVDDAELDQTRDGAPMINVWLVVSGGEFEGATVIDRLLPQHPKALFRVVGFMQAIGLPTPKKRLRLNIRQFIGKILEVDIEDGEPYNGRVKSEIRGYYRLERGTQAEADVFDDLPGEVMPDEKLPSREDLDDIDRMKSQVAASSAAARAVPDDERAADSEKPEDGSGLNFEPIDLDDLDLG